MARWKVLLVLAVSTFSWSGGQNARRRDCATFDGGIDMCSYESHDQMVRKLVNLATRYPGLALVNSVGETAEGRPMAYIKISGNVTQRSHLEPMFKYVRATLLLIVF